MDTQSSTALKYLIVATFSEALNKAIEDFLQRVNVDEGREESNKLPLHLTIHPPFWLEPNEAHHLETVRTIIRARVRRCESSQVTVCGPIMLGQELYVLPVAPSLGVARLWVGLHEAFTNLPLQGSKREFWSKNMPHITLVRNLSRRQEIISRLLCFNFPTTVGGIETIRLYTKREVKGGKWTEVGTYKLL